ncbi:hypothetical protein PLICRDRAFT_58515 [Plicaturopsis crispa FD-325 SS-3]|uniref:Uncharacterized protein n=1 Tax=Plicaturopsis crispa FD-325 SS-3 TaxID=944288 RepID=A0A0C9T262_PLICR|nr:hypothetical protein PLICRDRAFT_58515 [Plicaturopsis crispa FD-325 SS-3]
MGESGPEPQSSLSLFPPPHPPHHHHLPSSSPSSHHHHPHHLPSSLFPLPTTTTIIILIIHVHLLCEKPTRSIVQKIVDLGYGDQLDRMEEEEFRSIVKVGHSSSGVEVDHSWGRERELTDREWDRIELDLVGYLKDKKAASHPEVTPAPHVQGT